MDTNEITRNHGYYYGIPINFDQLYSGLEKYGFKKVSDDLIIDQLDQMMREDNSDMNAVHNYILHIAIENIVKEINRRDSFFRIFIQNKEKLRQVGTNTKRAMAYVDAIDEKKVL